MITWQDFSTDQPALAAAVAGRFAANLHGVLATLQPDGWPRLSGLEVPIREGHLWLSMMPGSAKVSDLRRDPRFALHSAPLEEDLRAGDAKVSGIAHDVSDDAAMLARFVKGTELDLDALPGGGMALFVADLTQVVLTCVTGEALVVRSWRPGRGLVRSERR